MSAVRNCGCDEITDSDTSKYDSNRHYFTCHLFKFDCNSPHTIDAVEPVKEDDRLDLSETFDDLVTTVLDDEVIIDSSIDLNTTFNEWMSKVLDSEAGRTSDLKKKINESLSRQLQDGLLSHYEYVDLEYIGGRWLKLLMLINSYNLGCVSIKKDIASLLVELFELKQISRSLLIATILQL